MLQKQNMANGLSKLFDFPSIDDRINQASFIGLSQKQGLIGSFAQTQRRGLGKGGGGGAAVPPNDVARVGSWSLSEDVGTLTHVNGAGSNRIMIVCTSSEGEAAEVISGIDYGGQALTKILNSDSSVNTIEMWYLLEAGIAAASTTTITVTYGTTPNNYQIHAATYEFVDQSTPIPDSNTDFTLSSTPNPMTACDLTEADGNALVSVITSGSVTTTTWGSAMTEQTDNATGSNTQSVSDRLSITDLNVDIEGTFATTNRAAQGSIELGKE